MFASDSMPLPSAAGARRASDGDSQAAPVLAVPVEEQVVSIWAGTNGKLDTVEVEDVLRFERELLDYCAANSRCSTRCGRTNVLDDDTLAALEKGDRRVLSSSRRERARRSTTPVTRSSPRRTPTT